MFDCHLNMSKHISTICRSASYHLHKIGSARKYLTTDATAQIIHAFITSRIDYCNSLLHGIPETSLQRLQNIQNTAARIISKTRKYDHITPVLKSLHWLPVHLRVIFKILLLTYRIHHGLAPAYLSDLLKAYNPTRSLRSSSQTLLVIPKSRLKTYGDRSFAVAAPKLWNELPKGIRCSDSLSIFLNRLKTHLFVQF